MKRNRTIQLTAGLAVLLATTGGVQSGLVRTVDGQLIEGDVALDRPDAIIVKRDGKSPMTIPLDRIVRATFTATDDALSYSGFLAEGWSAEDIGNAKIAGSAGWVQGKWYLRGGGGYIGEKEDGCYLVSTRVQGNSELVARVTAVHCQDRQGRAGIMLREVLQGRSKFAALLVKADGTFSFRGRTEWGQHAQIKFTKPAAMPFWLKLRKTQDQVLAFTSTNGHQWQAAGELPLALKRDYYAGITIANRNPKDACTAVLDQVDLVANGLRAEYYTDRAFERLQFERIDPQIDFTWGLGAPDERIGKDNFSVRWTGQVEPKYSESYLFYFDADDTAKLWVNGQAMPRRSLKKGAGKSARGLPLRAGRRYDLKMEFREGGGAATARLGWSSPSQALELIPADRFYCSYGPQPQAAPPLGPAPLRNVRLTKGLLLRSGTFLTGSVRSLDDQRARLRRQNGKDMDLFWHQVALAVFRVPKRECSLQEFAARTGVLLQNGDWFEGEVRGIKKRKLTISSVLYGQREFSEYSGEVAAWLLHGFQPEAAPFEVRLTDGSVLMARSLRLDPGMVVMKELSLGDIRIPQARVQEINCHRN